MIMRRFLMMVLLATACPTGPGWAAEQWGDLTATFLFDAEAPKAAPLKITKDTEFCNKFNVLDESLTVNPKNHGIANVVAYLYLAKNAAKPPVHPTYQETAKAKVKLDNNCCRFAPHVALLRTSQVLLMTNSDAIGHNCKVDTLSNPPINFTIPADGKLDHAFPVEERLPAKVSCSIHPWMSGWVVIRELPYMAVSDADGQLVIKNLPVGTWTFQFWHEKAGFVRQVRQDGKTVEWAKGRIEVTIKPGVNPLGEIKLAPAAFTE
jgi:hypothetical protein